jgi:hypothetical protein
MHNITKTEQITARRAARDQKWWTNQHQNDCVHPKHDPQFACFPPNTKHVQPQTTSPNALIRTTSRARTRQYLREQRQTGTENSVGHYSSARLFVHRPLLRPLLRFPLASHHTLAESHQNPAKKRRHRLQQAAVMVARWVSAVSRPPWNALAKQGGELVVIEHRAYVTRSGTRTVASKQAGKGDEDARQIFEGKGVLLKLSPSRNA